VTTPGSEHSLRGCRIGDQKPKLHPDPVYYWQYMGSTISPEFKKLADVRKWWNDNKSSRAGHIGVYILVKHTGGTFKDVVWAKEYID